MMAGLAFKAPSPDYEKPGDADKDNVYEVRVEATDAVGYTGTKDVKVTVTNMDEAGTVTMSQLQPRVGVAITASVTDLDGDVSGVTWQWSRSDASEARPSHPSPRPRRPPTSRLRTTPRWRGSTGPTLTLRCSCGRRRCTPTERVIPSQMVMTRPRLVQSVNAVAVDTRNRAPVFDDQDDDTKGVQNEATTREVAENTKAVAADDVADVNDDMADNVGAAVTAEDPDPNEDALVYALEGGDAAQFAIDRITGQIEVGAGTKLDYETKTTYMVAVRVTDSFGDSDTIAVTIMVTDMDEAPEIMKAPSANVAPEFASATTRRTVAENTVAGQDIGTPVAANDANGDAPTYALSGTDAASFDIDPDTGQLMTLAALDYETKDTYSVTVTASDSGGLSDSIDVTITVTNVDEGFEVSGPAAVDYAENRTDAVATYSATAPESATITWSLEGDDTADFEISAGGVLTFGSPPDYENPADADPDNVYGVTVKASDGTNEATLGVTVTVTDVDEDVATADPLKDKYDANDNDEIERSEVFAAINDYLDGGAGAPTRADVFKLIELYLGD